MRNHWFSSVILLHNLLVYDRKKCKIMFLIMLIGEFLLSVEFSFIRSTAIARVLINIVDIRNVKQSLSRKYIILFPLLKVYDLGARIVGEVVLLMLGRLITGRHNNPLNGQDKYSSVFKIIWPIVLFPQRSADRNLNTSVKRY